MQWNIENSYYWNCWRTLTLFFMKIKTLYHSKGPKFFKCERDRDEGLGIWLTEDCYIDPYLLKHVDSIFRIRLGTSSASRPGSTDPPSWHSLIALRISWLSESLLTDRPFCLWVPVNIISFADAFLPGPGSLVTAYTHALPIFR